MGAAAVACLPKTNPNPLAPAWWYPSEWLSEAPAGYRDEFQLYTKTTALQASQMLTVELDIYTAGECNFYWRGLGVFLYGGIGIPTVRVRDSEGYVMMNTRVALDNGEPFGNQDVVTPILVAHRMVPGAKLSLDFNETSGNPVTVLWMLTGINRWAYDPNIDGRGGAFGPDSPYSAGNPGIPGALVPDPGQAAGASGSSAVMVPGGAGGGSTGGL
jgi:hypothetical protein